MAGYDLFLNQSWRMPPELDQLLQLHVIEYAHLAVDDFTDLSDGGGRKIPDTARRAIRLEQLDLLAAHMIRRVVNNREKWMVKRFPGGVMEDHCITSAYGVLRAPHSVLNASDQVNLYDMCQHVIRPSTEKQALSMVELMCAEGGPDPVPDYFVSHVRFACLSGCHCWLSVAVVGRKHAAVPGLPAPALRRPYA